MTLSKQQIEDAANAIITTRDFCGNEREAFNDWCADNGIKPNDAIYLQANFRANAMWNSYQRKAGVPEKYIW